LPIIAPIIVLAITELGHSMHLLTFKLVATTIAIASFQNFLSEIMLAIIVPVMLVTLIIFQLQLWLHQLQL